MYGYVSQFFFGGTCTSYKELQFGKGVPARDNTGCIHSIYPILDIHKSYIHTEELYSSPNMPQYCTGCMC